MSLVEEYYELNEAEEVSAVWKAFQIGFYACAACLGLGCGFTLALLRQKFDDRCYLYTLVKASPLNNGKIDQSNVNWESDTWCDYYQFSMVSSFIVAVIWGTLFLMCGKGGKSLTGLPQPWRIVWPSLIFNLIYFLITLITAINIQHGTDYFCRRSDLNKKLESKTLLEKCEPLKLLLKKDLQEASLQLEIVVKASWGCVVSWLILFLLPFFRIVLVVDFQMYKICVFKVDDTVQNKKEEVLKITNYEEPKKLYFEEDEEKNYLPESEEPFEDLEAGTKKNIKTDKKKMRHLQAANRSSLHNDPTFYMMADIRLLKRGKKREKAFDEPFGKNNLRVDLTKSINTQAVFDLQEPSYGIPASLCSKKLFTDGKDEGEVSSSSTIRKPNSDKDWNDSTSGNEFCVGDFDSNRSLRFKKRI